MTDAAAGAGRSVNRDEQYVGGDVHQGTGLSHDTLRLGALLLRP